MPEGQNGVEILICEWKSGKNFVGGNDPGIPNWIESKPRNTACVSTHVPTYTQEKKTISPSRLRPDVRKDVLTYTHRQMRFYFLSLSLFCTKQTMYYTYKKKVIDEQFSSRIYLLTDVVLIPPSFFFTTYVYIHTYLRAE